MCRSVTTRPRQRTRDTLAIYKIIDGFRAISNDYLEAFTQLLQRLRSDTGMAFVLVQHLDPVKSECSDRASGPDHRLAGRRSHQ